MKTKWLEHIRGVANYIGAVLVMFAIILAAIACGSENLDAVKGLLIFAGVVAGSSAVPFTVALILDELIDELEEEI